MEISILFTILLMTILLGGDFFQVGVICFINREQINNPITIKYDLKNALGNWAVKLIMKGRCLLNTVALADDLKAAQTILIQLQNIEFEG